MNSRFGKAAAALAVAFLSLMFASPSRAVVGICGDEFCDSVIEEDCTTCPEDCGTCPPSTTTTTIDEPTTTTTLPETTTTTSPPDTTTTTLVAEGACCHGSYCSVTTESLCEGEYQGRYAGDGSSCEDPGVCVDCGNSCVDYGETCDDGDTEGGDGCDEKCAEEACYMCDEGPIGCLQYGLNVRCSQADLAAARNVIGPICTGPSTCYAYPGKGCSTCGNLEVEVGEYCDDGNTANGDCCDEKCQWELAGSPCADGTACDGTETCDGKGECLDSGTPLDCSSFDSECAVGVCDLELDACVADPSGKDGEPCEDETECKVPGSGVCTDGSCVGEDTTLAPSCRWIVVGASTEGPVKVRSGKGSVVDANTCGDTAKSAGITSASIVTTAAAGNGVYFYGPPEVAGDIVTGGASVDSNLYVVIPGTDQKTVAGGTTLAKLPSGIVDATGTHPLVDVCVDDKAAVIGAVAVLDAMPATGTAGGANGLKIPNGGSDSIDVTGDGVAVIDVDSLKVGYAATLTLTGLPTDVIMLRVTNGRMTLGYGSQLVLNGLVPSNVLIYSQGSRCRLSPGAVGGGTVFCPEAGKFVVGVGTAWSGTFLGGAREVQVRLGAQLTHTPFTGF